MTKTAPPEPDKGIYRVHHFLRVGATNHVCESDLIFLEGLPYVVLDWAGPQESQYPDPALILPLDPAQLEESRGNDGYFVYNGQLVDPRTQH